MQALIEFVNANALLTTGLVASALAVVFYELRLKARNVASLNIPMTVRMINDGGSVVDVRAADKFSAGHIVAAQNIPADKLLQDPAAASKKKRNVILVCDNGASSGECVAKLRKLGHDHFFSLRGGINEWRKEALPLVSKDQAAA